VKNRLRVSFGKITVIVFFCVSPALWAQSSTGTPAANSPVPTGSNTVASNTDRSNSTAPAATPVHDDNYVIGVDDVLAINVWKEAEISRSVPVRSDGKISLPLVGEVTAAGETPKKVEDEITAKLTNYISEPDVTVMVQEMKSQKINVLGQVVKPGSYPLTSTMTVLDAIAIAGGFRDFAKQKHVYVLRQQADGTQARLPFNYKDVIKGKNPNQNVKLQSRDTVVIP
jgi:polysaccharide export outer membrane protein